MAKKSTCKAQLKSRIRHARTKKERGKALGAYQKCIKGSGSRRGRPRHRRGKHYKYWKGGWGED